MCEQEKSEGIRDTGRGEVEKTEHAFSVQPLRSSQRRLLLDEVPFLERSRAGKTPAQVVLLTWSVFPFFRPAAIARTRQNPAKPEESLVVFLQRLI